MPIGDRKQGVDGDFPHDKDHSRTLASSRARCTSTYVRVQDSDEYFTVHICVPMEPQNAPSATKAMALHLVKPALAGGRLWPSVLHVTKYVLLQRDN